MLNNTFFSIISKIPNKVVYGFILRRFLNLLGFFPLFQPLVIRAKAANIISFAISNSKAIYNPKYQTPFIKVGD